MSENNSSSARAQLDPKQSFFSELPGSVCAQYRRRGEKVFGPYWFRFWREGGKLKKAYVSKEELESVRALCEARRKRLKGRRMSRIQARAARSSSTMIYDHVELMKQTFAVSDLLDRKDESQLTPLQKQRVERLLAKVRELHSG